MRADHRRWELELGTPSPDATRKELGTFIAQRPNNLMAHLAKYSNRRLRSVTIDAPPRQQGVVLLEGLRMEERRTAFQSFEGIDLRVEVVAAEGWEFAGWKGERQEGAGLRFDAGSSKHVKPLFRPIVP